MKSRLILFLLLGGLWSAFSQEKVPHDQALQYAAILTNYTKELRATPIPTHPDFTKPVAVRAEGHGGLVVPEQGLTTETISRAKKEVAPLGQLWLVKLTPMDAESAVPVGKLHMVHVLHGDNEVDAACCALGVQKTGSGPELLVYGKGKAPILRVPFKEIATAQEDPIDITGERNDDSGTITLSFAGKYQASFKVTDPDRD